MGRKERRQGAPELDPFGANDPAWERYEGISQLRRLARARASRSGPDRSRSRWQLVAAMLILVPVIVGLIVVVVRLLID